MNMTKIEQAIEVLKRARDGIVSEIVTCGSNGGVGRAQNYAPVFLSVHNSVVALENMLLEEDAAQEPEVEGESVHERMARLRAKRGSNKNQK